MMAPMHGMPGFSAGTFFAHVGMTVGIGIVFAIVTCYLLSDALKRLPFSFRKMEHGLVWLLLIPCFNVIWNFFVFPKVSDSYSTYFASQGRTDVGDAGRMLGLAYAICNACIFLGPCFFWITVPASLVLLIIYLVKITGLKNQVQQPPQA